MSVCGRKFRDFVCVLEEWHDGPHRDATGEEFRIPLHPLPEAERLAELKRMGLSPDLTPVNPSPLEREANAMIANPTPAPSTTQPLISDGLKKAAMAVASACGIALLVLPSLPFALPAWLGLALFAAASVSGLLAGAAMPQFMPSKPVLPVALVPTALSIAASLAVVAGQMAPGTLQNVVLVLSALCTTAAGKALPAPVKDA